MKKKLTISTTACIELHYLPPIAFWANLMKYDKVTIEQQENYQKGSYRNRCHLAGANGLLRLSIPLAGGKNQQQAITQVGIDNSQDWQTQHWRSIQSAYGKTPFFEHYEDEFRDFYKTPFQSLFTWNKTLFLQVIHALEMPLEVSWTTEYHSQLPEGTADLRNLIRPKSQEYGAFTPIPYPQAFLEKNGFLPNLSILDLLFCTGPQSIQILEDAIAK